MTEQHFGKAYGGKPPVNYERFLSQRLARPWQLTSYTLPRLV